MIYITICNHEEIWIPINTFIPDIKNIYFISSHGRVTNSKKIMKIFNVPNGYQAITLTFVDGKQKRFYIHRLVALAFILNRNPKKNNQVNHLNGNKNDNYKENLEWCDSNTNIVHAINMGLRENLYGVTHHKNKYSEEFIHIICHYNSMGFSPVEIMKNINMENSKSIRRLIKHIKRKEQWVSISKDYF